MQANLFRPDDQTMYQALLDRNSQFEGIFIVGVKTTGIFCRPTCAARKPKFRNVEFFSGTKEALAHGYRPCKVCHPMKKYGETPDWIKDLLEQVESNPGRKFKDQDLRNMDLQPEKVRRWFLKNHGITFHAFTRSLRVNEAFRMLKSGKKMTDLAYDTGYESLSGFTSNFKKTVGTSPTVSRGIDAIVVNRIPTPLGPMLAGATSEAICLLEFTDRKMLETQIEVLKKRYKRPIISGNHELIDQLSSQLEQYFRGERQEFTVPLDYPGTQFQMKVWEALIKIRYGQTMSYGGLSLQINNPKAVRAVGRANGENRIAILIPCHRVIGSDGELTGYGGGIWRKQYLLQLESKNTPPQT